MSFPLSPSNGQQAVVNGILYTWNSTKSAWRRVTGTPMTGDQPFDGNIIANSGAVSVSTTTGAIQVTRGGGIGVTGNVNAGAFYSDNYFYANGASIIVEAASTANTSGNIQGGDAGQLVYQSAANVTSFLATADYGKILAANGLGNAPVWLDLQELAALTGTPYITQLVYPEGNIGASDAGGDTIYALGSGFQPGFNITINNAPVVTATYITSSNVAFVTNPTTIGHYPLTITNPNRKSFTYEYIEFIGAGSPYFINPAGYLNFVAQNLGFNQYILVAGGYKPYNFEITAGSLPGTMTIDAGSGLISGYAPSVENPTSFSFTVKVTDAHGQIATRNFYILVTVPVVLNNQLALSSQGSDYLRASATTANLLVDHTLSISSMGSDYIRTADADANVQIEHTMTLSSVGSDFIRSADADANVSIDHLITLSSSHYSR